MGCGQEEDNAQSSAVENREEVKSTGTPTGPRYQTGRERHPFF